LPDPEKQRQFDALVGLDDVKTRLVKEGQLLLNPSLLEKWSKTHHRSILPAVERFRNRPPLIVFSGDVGTGKTTLADSFGDPVARASGIKVRVARLSLKTRGAGAVGEMTRLITQAFEELERLVPATVKPGQTPPAAAVLVIDEADALAQSREFDQMHHEDRAGVNALIRGIDRLTTKRLPVLILMCTNRLAAIDPAIMRRAAAHYIFQRPTTEQRAHVLRASFDGVFTADEITKLADLTGPTQGRAYGYTYSDLTQRLIPSLVLQAFPDGPITFELAATVLGAIEPTKPFSEMAK